MRNLPELENQLRSWTPRKPSAKLKERIFGPNRNSTATATLVFGGNWRWLAPVMGSFLLAMMVLSPKDERIVYFASGTNDLMETLARNSGRAAYLAESFHSRQNTLDRDILEWTYDKRSSSSIGSFQVINTNTLLR